MAAPQRFAEARLPRTSLFLPAKCMTHPNPRGAAGSKRARQYPAARGRGKGRSPAGDGPGSGCACLHHTLPCRRIASLPFAARSHHPPPTAETQFRHPHCAPNASHWERGENIDLNFLAEAGKTSLCDTPPDCYLFNFRSNNSKSIGLETCHPSLQFADLCL